MWHAAFKQGLGYQFGCVSLRHSAQIQFQVFVPVEYGTGRFIQDDVVHAGVFRGFLKGFH